ncbi:MAG: polymerase sigma-70 factor, subfamily [Pseudomonadota bacterium]|nr:polymerase sigma-70 factor, subfamily [Pseudomonadota bacterium]
MSAFLADVERRAFKYAMFALRDEHCALDVVQDAMLKLAEKYSAKPADELPALFQRILQNQIRDFLRRQKVRSLWASLLSVFSPVDDESANADPLDALSPAGALPGPGQPELEFQQRQLLQVIEQGLQQLPLRQRQAFLLRYWEEMDVAETAAAMGCSPGSVKTHCSRATHALAEWLKKKGVDNE